MKSTLRLIGRAGFVLLCLAALRIPATPQIGDSLRIQNIGPPPQTPLMVTNDQRTRISMTLNYVLASADRASLAVFAEEYPGERWGMSRSSTPDEWSELCYYPEGAGAPFVQVIWPPDSVGAKPLYPTGYVTLGANLWTVDRLSLIRSFGLFSQICYHFASASAPSQPMVQPIPMFYSWQPASNGSVPPGAVVGGYSSVQPQPISTAVSYGTP